MLKESNKNLKIACDCVFCDCLNNKCKALCYEDIKNEKPCLNCKFFRTHEEFDKDKVENEILKYSISWRKSQCK